MKPQYYITLLILTGFQTLIGQTNKVKGDHFQYQINGQKETWKILNNDLSKRKNFFEEGIDTNAFQKFLDTISTLKEKILTTSRENIIISSSNKSLLDSSLSTIQHASNYFIERIQNERKKHFNFEKDKYTQITITPGDTKSISEQIEQLIPQLKKIEKISWNYTDIIDVRNFKELLRLIAKDLMAQLEKLVPQLQQVSNKIIVTNELKKQQAREERSGVKPRK